MLIGNAMQKAMVEAGLAEEHKPRKPRKGKVFKCHKCGLEMVNPDWGNFMVCPSCDNSYFIFSNK